VTTPPARTGDIVKTLAVVAGGVIITLTIAAFWLSYAHLAEVALGHGLGKAEARAWAWPACLDLFIVAGELLWLRAALAHRVDLWAIGLTVIGSGGSIALNVAGVSSADPLDYVVAAVPPTAALLAFGALMRQVHGALAARVEAAPEAPRSVERKAPGSAPSDASVDAPKAPPVTAPGRPETTLQGAPADAPGAPVEAPRTKETERPEGAPKGKEKAPRKAPSKSAPRRPRSASRADAKAAIEALYDTKKRRPLESEMTAALLKLKSYPHTSRQHANKLRGEIERDRPDLAALGSDNVLALTGS
jgi:hypothetical protein